MGKILKSKFKTPVEIGFLLAIVLGVVYLVYTFAPQIGIREAFTGSAISLDSSVINNVEDGDELPLPSNQPSTEVSKKPLFRVGGYPWNGQTAIMASAGGRVTKKGSLMEANGLNFEFMRKDGVGDLRDMMLKFVDEFDKGHNSPQSKLSAQGIIVMGDGGPFFLSTTQEAINSKYGEGKYNVQAVGAFGMSRGEDKLVGPMKWKDNPKSMLGSVISVVYGDGNWVVMLNYCFANGLAVNPDEGTYDPNAVNLYPSANDDFIESAKELIKSQKDGWTVPLKEKINGKLTGKTVNRKIDGMASWTPADKIVFDALSGFGVIVSTKDFNNQMPTTLFVIREWADQNPHIINAFMKSAYTAGNQIKLYDSWARRGAEANAESFGMENGDYWYGLFKGIEGEKNGIPYFVGGSSVMNLADAKQYYGLSGDGISRYESVWTQVSQYLSDLKPFGFNSKIPSYDQAVNTQFVQNVMLGNSTGKVDVTDYSKTATEQVASGSWRFNFATGSADISASSSLELNKLYNILVQAESTKMNIIGHTDNVGDPNRNRILSKQRAESVKNWLIQKGINPSRIQLVDGRGQDEPLSENTTEFGRSNNRRTDVVLLK